MRELHHLESNNGKKIHEYDKSNVSNDVRDTYLGRHLTKSLGLFILLWSEKSYFYELKRVMNFKIRYHARICESRRRRNSPVTQPFDPDTLSTDK